MTSLHFAFIAVVVIVIVVFGLVYWHESRRPEVRSRPEDTDRSEPSAAEADGDRPTRRGPG